MVQVASSLRLISFRLTVLKAETAPELPVKPSAVVRPVNSVITLPRIAFIIRHRSLIGDHVTLFGVVDHLENAEDHPDACTRRQTFGHSDTRLKRKGPGTSVPSTCNESSTYTTPSSSVSLTKRRERLSAAIDQSKLIFDLVAWLERFTVEINHRLLKHRIERSLLQLCGVTLFFCVRVVTADDLLTQGGISA